MKQSESDFQGVKEANGSEKSTRNIKRFLYHVLILSGLILLGYIAWRVYPAYLDWQRKRTAEALSNAIRHQDLAEIRTLLSKENINFPLIYSIDTHEPPPLFLAASVGNRKILLHLLEHGADLKMKNFVSAESVLHFASDPEIADLLIQKGADINAVDCWSNTPLASAIHGRWSLELISELITNNANVNCLDNANRSLLDNILIEEKRLAAIKQLLLAHGAKTGQEIAKEKGKSRPIFEK
ncbi:MAG: hypothetical protein NTY53_06790 [Kiritimatiellaeota bacterium]|nr:hypothetical protein [Kiritimatiellota bacterium]